jgi:hypothetical protein
MRNEQAGSVGTPPATRPVSSRSHDAGTARRDDAANMKDQQIRLKAVYELRVDESGAPTRYFIPAYQRGYRWNATQVTQLLDDIHEFARRKNPQPEEFYCLQPLVLLARQDGAYEVVDGQQRLTTLLLVLRHFNDRAAKKYQQTLYTLEYVTRPDLLSFLEDPTDARAAKNIDYFHIAQAVKVIEAWFAERESEVEAIKDTFLNKAQVIWFQLSAGENPVAAFTRLNVGKIPLTNAELIRALFLRTMPGEAAEARRLRIAYEWDLIEKALQDAAFWSFLRNDTGRSGGRIDVLFDLAARQQGMIPRSDDYATFNHFSQKLGDNDADPAEAWLEVKKICMLLEEWYEDRHLYHLAGFLIWAGADVNELRNMAAGSRKRELKEKLRAQVVQRAFGAEAPTKAEEVRAWIAEELDDLVYPRDRGRIRSILLLFNLATLLQHPQSNIRFHFESFKTANWDIEHVRSVASAELGSPSLQEGWLSQTLRYLELTAQEPVVVTLQEKIKAHLTLTPKEGVAAFERLYGEILKHFHEDDTADPDNSVANLALLDQETNRSYKNAVFPVKRQRVLELDAHGVFVPHCTRNVFLKSYSPQVGHAMYWTQQDRDGYREEMINTLYIFITGTWIHA